MIAIGLLTVAPGWPAAAAPDHGAVGDGKSRQVMSGPGIAGNGTEESAGATRRFFGASVAEFPSTGIAGSEDELTGFGRDLADAVINAAGGVLFHMHSPDPEEVLNWVDNGRADFIHDTLVTSPNAKLVDLTDPILTMREQIFVRADQYEISGIDSLAGRTVACIDNHVTFRYLRTLPGIDCRVVDSPVRGVNALVDGEVDAFIYPRQSLLYFIRTLNLAEKVKTVGEPLRTLTWSMSVRKGNDEMLAILNEGIAKVRATGQYNRIYEKWFGASLVIGHSHERVWASIGVLAAMAALIGMLILLLFYARHLRAAKSPLNKITAEHSAAHTALTEKSAHVESVFENISQGISVFDSNLKLIAFNKTYVELLGYSPGFIRVGMPYEEVVRCNVERGDYGSGDIEEQIREIVLERPRDLRMRYERVQPDGKVLAVRRDPLPDGSTVATFTNITKRKMVERSLRESEERVRRIMENVTDGIIVIDEKGIIKTANPAAEKIFGYRCEEMLDQNVSMLMPQAEGKQHLLHISKYLKTGKAKIVGIGPREITGRHKDGSTFALEIAVSEMWFGKERRFVGITRDITERKLIESRIGESQRLEAIGQLAGGIAHDFNNLLMVIGGYTQRAFEHNDDERLVKDALIAVLAAKEKAAKLTKQLLMFGGRQMMEEQVLRVAEVLTEVKGLLNPLIGEQYELTIEAPARNICVKTDAGELTQALVNLAINARDAMPSGGPIVIGARMTELDEAFVTRHPGTAAGTYAEIYVVDQGEGIDEEDLQHIFEPFFTTKDQGKGTGLGLAMVYGFVHQASGVIDVTSKPGEGSTFRLYLPVTDAEPYELVSEFGEEACGNGETILLAEDDAAVRQLVNVTLKEAGFNVLAASDGFEALEAEENHPEPIDLLLTDVVMPNLSGFDLAKIMRKTRPNLQVVFMSGYPSRGDLKAVEVPEDATFLQKPVNPPALIYEVRKALDLAQSNMNEGGGAEDV